MKETAISIIGTGYVGLCTAIGFASQGYPVITSTQNPENATAINKGIPPFYEPDLQKTLQKVIKKGSFQCVVDQEQAILNTDITFVAKATPSRPNGSIDLKYIKSSARDIGQALKKKDHYHLIVIKSTVVPGTTETLVKPALEKHSKKQCGSDFGLCMSPEFLREGSALHDTLHPDRLIIGEHDKTSGDTLEALHTEFHDGKPLPTIRTNLATAELIKYANNTFLATKISFINTIANICEKVAGTDITTVAKGLGLDHRINPRFLRAGLGYGGSCFSKDVNALVAFSHQRGYNAKLLNAVRAVNEAQAEHIVETVRAKLKNLKGKRIAILGLSFKPNTNDMRDARSIPIINRLLAEGAQILAYDPVTIPNAKALFGEKITYASSAVECLKGANCCILVTEWSEFTKLTPEDFIQTMLSPIVIDGRRIYNPAEFRKKLTFEAIGLGQSPKTSGTPPASTGTRSKRQTGYNS